MNTTRVDSHFSKVTKLNKTLLFSLLLSALSFNAMADYQVEDSEGVKTLEAQPVRVAALNWDIAEQVIELGVTPSQYLILRVTVTGLFNLQFQRGCGYRYSN